jgi:hypothetical protein
MAATSNDRGVLQAERQACLDFHVSLDSLRRAPLVIDALIKALERRGFAASVVVGEAKTRLPVLGETVAIGKLSLRIRRPTWLGRTTWAGGQKQRAEKTLNHSVVALMNTAPEERERRLEREESERKRKEEERRAAERERRRKREERRLRAPVRRDTLLDPWLADACVQRSRQGRRREVARWCSGGRSIDKWITWAPRRANRLGPLGEGAPRERKMNPYALSAEREKAIGSVDIVWERLSQSVGPKEEAW